MVKEEPFEFKDEVIKIGPEFISVQSESYSTKQTFKNDLDHVFGNRNSICEYQATENFPNGTIKQEIIESEVPKIEHSDHDSVLENVQTFTAAIKTELENCIEVKPVVISDINQEVSQYVQFKEDNDFLTSHCDLPTLKNENTDYTDYFAEPCSSREPERTLKSPKHTKKLVSKQKRYRRTVCRRKCKLEQDLEDIIIAGGDDDDIEAVILWSILGDEDETDDSDLDDLSASD